MLCGEAGTAHFVLNVILFFPLGIGLALVGVRPLRALAIAASGSLLIEAAQYIAIAGRDASLGDLVANSLGCMVGAGVGRRWPLLLLPSPRAARQLAFAALGGWLAVAVATEWALTPVFPATTYLVQWKSERPQFAYNYGSAHSATLNGMPIVPGSLPNRGALAETIRRDGIVLRANVVPSIPLIYLSDFVTIFGGENQEITILAQAGRAFVFRTRLRASELQLRNPGLALEGVFPGITRYLPRGPTYDSIALDSKAVGRLGNAWSVDSAPIALSGEASRMRLSATAVTRNASLRTSQSLTPELGWSLFWTTDVSLGTGRARALSAIWIALLLMPFGYWCGRADWRAVVLIGAAVIALGLGLAAIPAAFGAHVPAAPTWMAGAAGILIAYSIGRMSTRLQSFRPPRASAPPSAGAPDEML